MYLCLNFTVYTISVYVYLTYLFLRKHLIKTFLSILLPTRNIHLTVYFVLILSYTKGPWVGYIMYYVHRHIKFNGWNINLGQIIIVIRIAMEKQHISIIYVVNKKFKLIDMPK